MMGTCRIYCTWQEIEEWWDIMGNDQIRLDVINDIEVRGDSLGNKEW